MFLEIYIQLSLYLHNVYLHNVNYIYIQCIYIDISLCLHIQLSTLNPIKPNPPATQFFGFCHRGMTTSVRMPDGLSEEVQRLRWKDGKDGSLLKSTMTRRVLFWIRKLQHTRRAHPATAIPRQRQQWKESRRFLPVGKGCQRGVFQFGVLKQPQKYWKIQFMFPFLYGVLGWFPKQPNAQSLNLHARRVAQALSRTRELLRADLQLHQSQNTWRNLVKALPIQKLYQTEYRSMLQKPLSFDIVQQCATLLETALREMLANMTNDKESRHGSTVRSPRI